MIGFNYLGKMGQLGNQMFQYASLRGIAKNRGFDFCIPYHNEVFDDGIGNKLRIELFDPFVMKNLTQSNIGIIENEIPVLREGLILMKLYSILVLITYLCMVIFKQKNILKI